MFLFESLLVSISTYSAIPVPQFEWNDRNMKYGMHDGDYKVMIGTSCEDIVYTVEASVRSGRINLNGG